MKSHIDSGAIYELIKKEMVNLPGKKAHLEMIPYRSIESLSKNKEEAPKQSAVLCLLSNQNKTIEITLMERTIDGSPHSGQISFPGGKMELDDKNLANTALRETYEEIGIIPENIELMGQLTPLYIPVSNFEVTPFIGLLKTQSQLTLSKLEVKAVFTITIDDLLNPKNVTKQDIPNHLGQVLKKIPCFLIQGKIIWGATSLILNEVKQIFQLIDHKY